MTSPRRLVLLPTQGFRAAPPVCTESLCAFFRSLALPARPRTRGAPHLRVLDAIGDHGPRLVEIASEDASALRAAQPGIRLAPVTWFRTAVAPRNLPVQRPAAGPRAASVSVRLTVLSRHDGKLVAGAQVIAFTDFERRIGAEGITDRRGTVRLALGAAGPRLSRLFVYPKKNFWGAFRKNLPLASEMELPLDPVDCGWRDALRHFYGNAPDGDGRRVRVGVVDTGIDLKHPDLRVEGGQNTVVGEQPSDYGDNGAGHGTHVAGIIAARGIPPAGLRGLAPEVELRSYRVFPKNKEEASNYSIAKAMDAAVHDGCDLVNLSLGGGPPDEVTRAAIEHARSHGALVIVAAGNGSRAPVSFPAPDSLAVAVAAMGRKGAFPAGATEEGDVAAPYGTDRQDFVAAFSNIGAELDLIAPGVGILSTIPGGYAPMSGTSMACPAATGLAARWLAASPQILDRPRDAGRSAAMATLVLGAARSLGFGPKYEGQGMTVLP